MKVYVQSKDERVLKEAYGTVYNMLLHDEAWLKWIKRHRKPFLLVHGGFQGKMASLEEIVDFALKYRPELVVAPDVYKNQERTSELTIKFVEICPQRLMKKVVAVMQGGLDIFEETLKLYDRLGFRWLGFPSDNYSITDLVDHVKSIGWKVHILGDRWSEAITHNIDSVDIVVDDYSYFKRWWAWRRFYIPTE